MFSDWKDIGASIMFITFVGLLIKNASNTNTVVTGIAKAADNTITILQGGTASS